MTRTTAIRTAALGFSLVEVLIAVFVLALGLLGLGAVFPVVVREQRIASDATLGLGAMNSIKSELNARSDLRRFNPSTGQFEGGWVEWISNTTQQRGLPYDNSSGGWPGWNTPPIDAKTGTITLGTGTSEVEILVGSRLFPAPHTEGLDPRFVWDFVGKRIPRGDPNDPSDDALMVALFLRRIDPGIRLPVQVGAGTISLARALTDDSLKDADRRSPVGARRDGTPSNNGLSELGRRNYSRPLVAELFPDFLGPGVGQTQRDLIALSDAMPAQQRRQYEQMLGQTGQRFVDAQGNVYRVVSATVVNPTLPMVIRIDPPIPMILQDLDGDGEITPADLSPITFVPQAPPVDPVVFVIEP
ncbi:MAG TPA: hypothetical protein PLU35_08280 [Phycisphaerales bacterium]|nr:hypothetical protein [Phycisphaerales bacterium]